MFVSYAFLHAGLWHLVSNLVALFVVGPSLARRVGPRGFLAIWFASVVGGGLGFGLLSSSPDPMVGASGALFGLVGAWHWRDWRQRRARGLPVRPLLQAIVGLAVLNLAMWVLLSGLLAWETHLGGYLAGAAAAAAIAAWRARRRRLRRCRPAASP
jgi:membrane associated rhomboid family serine protease